MKKRIFLSILLVLVSLFMVNGAYAGHGEPQGQCPKNFELHHFMAHEEHEDHHIGTTRDVNGDGWICVKHLDNGLHVHVDNVRPLD